MKAEGKQMKDEIRTITRKSDRRSRKFLHPSSFILHPLLVFTLLLPAFGVFAQRRIRNGSHASRPPDTLTVEDRDLVERAIGIVCLERARDDKGSAPIDDMQKQLSLPLRAPEVVAGAQRAQRLLPVAKSLVIKSLRRLSTVYQLSGSRNYAVRINRAIARVQLVNRVKPDVEARDNASVYLKNPHQITFGTIFLAGLPSDESMVSVLAHELVHIADGDADSLQPLFRAIGSRASRLAELRIRDQRAEELTCDLVGEMAARSLIFVTPNYEPLPRRLARSIEHNCVDEDESDEDHLSPRNTIRVLLALDQTLRLGLVSGR
jgi:hypothetical protein